MAAAFFIILHLLSAKLYHVKIDAAINFLEVVLEGIVLLSDFLTTRWVTAYERQQRRDQDIHRSHTPSWYKMSVSPSIPGNNSLSPLNPTGRSDH
jgi:hypothetical protein